MLSNGQEACLSVPLLREGQLAQDATTSNRLILEEGAGRFTG